MDRTPRHRPRTAPRLQLIRYSRSAASGRIIEGYLVDHFLAMPQCLPQPSASSSGKLNLHKLR
jgi:hypothetical protein